MTSTEASSSEEKAVTLRALHVPGDPLVLPNALQQHLYDKFGSGAVGGRGVRRDPFVL